jgi:hypothetical protein
MGVMLRSSVDPGFDAMEGDAVTGESGETVEPAEPTEPAVDPTEEPVPSETTEPVPSETEAPVVEPTEAPIPLPTDTPTLEPSEPPLPVLLLVWDANGNAWLVPGVALTGTDSWWQTVISLVEGVIQLPEPIEPMPYEPMPID